MELNDICLNCKKLCKRLETEDVKNCRNYTPVNEKKELNKKNTEIKKPIIIIKK